MNRTGKVLLPAGLLGLVLAAWKLAVELLRLPVHVLPAPEQVALRFAGLAGSSVIQMHLGVTLVEIAAGFGAGLAFGLAAGVLLARHELLERVLSPFILVFQTAPKISLAPLFVLWFGLGIESKLVLIGLVTFFPIMLNTVVGLRSINPEYLNLLKILGASSRQRLFKVELMNALPFLLTGMRVGLVLSVTAAIIGEMMGARAGLGFLLMTGNEMYDLPLVLSAIIVISLLGWSLDTLARLAQERLLAWHESAAPAGETA
jgi:NitT/TauT family transport system permease protein